MVRSRRTVASETPRAALNCSTLASPMRTSSRMARWRSDTFMAGLVGWTVVDLTRQRPCASSPSCCQLRALAQRFEQAALVGNALAGDVEGGAVIDRGADHFQANGDVHTRLKPQHLYRTVALVVIHRHHQIEVTATGAEKQGVGRQRAGDIKAALLQQLHRRDDFFFLFTVAEPAIFTGMRIDTAYADAWARDTGLDQRRIAALDGALDQPRLDLADRVGDADVWRGGGYPPVRG